jgi:hypothetical protein
MSKYVCTNKECKNFGVQVTIAKNTYKLVDGMLRSSNDLCPICGQIRQELNTNIPLSEKNIELGKYSMASKEEKTAMLKKRSHEHFEKKIKPYKEHIWNETVKSFKGGKK